MFSLRFLFLTIVLSVSSLFKVTAQSNVFYFGWDTTNSYLPSDVLLTSNNELLIVGDANSSLPLIENYIYERYLVMTNLLGDTLWTKSYKQPSFGQPSIIELTNGDFLSFGRIDAGNVCNGIGTWTPISDLASQLYDNVGDSITTTNVDFDCDDYLLDAEKNTDGSMSTLTRSRDFSSNDSYHIIEYDINGNSTFTSILTNWSLEIQKTGNGYWVSSHNKLYKYNFQGDTMWSRNMEFIPYISDFCKVNADSLVFTYSSSAASYGDTVHVVKTDSLGNMVWNRKYYLRATDVLHHSSGNYVITGKRDSSLQILTLNADGDSIFGFEAHLPHTAFSVKSIELLDGSIATIGSTGGYGMPDQYVLMINSALPSGLSQSLSESPIHMYPNPTTGLINVNTYKSEITKVQLLDTTGKLLKEYSQNVNRLDISNLTCGIYFFSFFANDTFLYSRKIVKL